MTQISNDTGRTGCRHLAMVRFPAAWVGCSVAISGGSYDLDEWLRWPGTSVVSPTWDQPAFMGVGASVPGLVFPS